MKINKLIIITVLTTVLMSVNAFAETVRAIKLNLTYDGKTVEYREKEVKILGFEDLKDMFNPDYIGLNGSPTNVFKSFPKQAKGKGEYYPDLSADEAVKTIVAKLEEKHII